MLEHPRIGWYSEAKTGFAFLIRSVNRIKHNLYRNNIDYVQCFVTIIISVQVLCLETANQLILWDVFFCSARQ